MAMAAAAYLFVLLLAAPAAHAAQHIVGDSSGWSQTTDLGTWASGETFAVGDTLVFNYGSSHGVDVVSQDDYNNCNSGSALKSYTGGQTTVTLGTAGSMYFMCPTAGHCQGGMKMAITVGAASTTPSTGTPTTPSGSPTPTTSSPPSTHTSNGGAACSMNFVMLGFSLVVGSLAAFMG